MKKASLLLTSAMALAVGCSGGETPADSGSPDGGEENEFPKGPSIRSSLKSPATM